MNDYSTWIITAAFILAAPILVYFASKMWAMGQAMGKVRARDRIRREKKDENNHGNDHLRNRKERK